MFMRISGIQKTSLIDYPGKVAAIIFTQGCVFRCGYCHNPELIPPAGESSISEDEVLQFLQKRNGVLDGLVITGGEPTIQKDLPEFIDRVRTLGYLIKLDTNGSNPSMLKKLIEDKALDYIAMDIKAPGGKYSKVTQVKVGLEKIKKSIELIMTSGIDYEFRSTILPKLHTAADVLAMAKMIKGAKKYYLQTFISRDHLWHEDFVGAKPFTSRDMIEMAKKCSKFVEKCEVR